MSMPNGTDWPALPLAEWQTTLNTLHFYTQVAGKIRLQLAPPEPEWGHVPLYVTARGLTTSPMPYGNRTFQLDFDLIGHEFVIAVSDGQTRRIELAPHSVASFYEQVMEALRSLDISVEIWTMPQEVPNPIPFEVDTVHASYDRPAVERFFQVLARVDAVVKEYRAGYRARHTPVNFYWGGFDLCYTRYSGRPASPPPNANLIMRLSNDAEEINAGFWLGDARFPEPAFFAYTYPKPAGLENESIKPRGAFWNKDLGLFLVRYEDIRQARSPRAAILEFLRSTYNAGVTTGGWELPKEALS